MSAALAVGVGATGVGFVGWGSSGSTATCRLTGAPLQVVAAPEIAPVIAELVEARREGSACPRPVVRSEEPARTAWTIASGKARPDVWVPDSSLWAGSLSGAHAPREESPSVASSPFVLAVPARRLGLAAPGSVPVDRLLPSPTGARTRFALADPRRSSASVGAFVMVTRTLQGRSDAPGTLAALLRNADVAAPTGLEEALAGRSATTPVVPTTEQSVVAHNVRHADGPLALAYPERGRRAADYPFVTMAADRSRQVAARDLLAELRGSEGHRLLAAAGFRDRSGRWGQPPPDGSGARSEARAPHPLRVEDRKSAARAVDTIRRPSRLLTILDVSGSMAAVVPGTGGLTRLDVAVRALLTGVATYRDETVAGLWTFSTRLTPKTDYRELVPPVPLGAAAYGVDGRTRFVTALSRIRAVPDGGTGLYDTVLAAVRQARADWDPDRVNSVVVVTDGADDDSDSIGLDRLVQTLAEERDPRRPVAVFAIAYGSSADLAALRTIVRATGGVAYPALDYRDLPAAIADGIGQRVDLSSQR